MSSALKTLKDMKLPLAPPGKRLTRPRQAAKPPSQIGAMVLQPVVDGDKDDGDDDDAGVY